MRRRYNRARTNKKDEEFQPNNVSDQDQQQEKDLFESEELENIKDTKNKSKVKQAKKNSKIKKTVSKDMSEESGDSEIVQFRQGDQTMKQHVRPDFLKRWDGVSNELQITEEQFDSMSPMISVYWRTKSRNMRAVVFLQLGSMEYFAFENDAIMLSQMSKKRLKRFSKFLMVNFWYKEIEQTKKQLFQKRIPVLVMNQIEDHEYRATYGIIKRQIGEVITPALHPYMQTNTTGRERLLLAIYKDGESFSIVLLDGETNQFYTEEIKQDKYLHQIRRVINRYRPVEVVLPHKGHNEIAQIARQICDPYIVQLKLQDLKDIGNALDEILNDNKSSFLVKLKEKYDKQSKNSKFSKYRTVSALFLVRQYLTYLSLKEKVFQHAIFNQNDSENFRPPFFDSQVYENLQLFRLSLSEEDTYCKPGTLLHFVDHCKTQQGRKLLHGWIDCPPSSLHDVIQRQQAVNQIVQNQQVLKHHDRLIAYEKLGKKLGDVYHWVARQSQRGKIILTKGINFQKEYNQTKNPAVQRLKQLVEIAKLLTEYEEFLKTLTSNHFKSPLLKKYTHLIEVENLHKLNEDQLASIEGIPAISYVANLVLNQISYDPVSGHLEPSPGQSQVYDQNKQQFQRIQDLLNRQLAKWTEFFGTNKVQFVSVRAKNQIQVPKSAIKTSGKSHPHPDLIFSSQIAGSVRYTTAQTSALSMQQVVCEEAMAQAYEPFLQKILIDFSKYRYLWDRFVTSSAWIDAIFSLAKASNRMGVRCLPIFREQGLSIKSAVHPSLSEVIQDIVSNNLLLQANQRTLLLTGPNMGGKSTLLKQTCLLAVLAQIGCYVPAKEYIGPIFDQIFCRMGASDRIYEGKSTFYVQLQQTKRILNKATSRSLVIIDELGRGTSTFDGMAIAEAVLDHLIYKIRPITMFSTHYTQITQRYANNSGLRLAKMGYEILQQGKLGFTYQLIDGVAQKSFANNVSRMVGIKQSIMSLADKKSDEMHHQTKRKKNIRQACRLAGVIGNRSNPKQRPSKNKMDKDRQEISAEIEGGSELKNEQMEIQVQKQQFRKTRNQKRKTQS